MNFNPLRNGWFFPVHETPIHATVTRNGAKMDVIVPHKKALVAADSGEIVGVGGDGYNPQRTGASRLCCRRAGANPRL